MCSILAVLDLAPDDDLAVLRPRAVAASARQRHRGPDWSGVHAGPGGILVHERLAIVDPAGGAQPIVSAGGDRVLAVNGEIWNHRALAREVEAGRRAREGAPWAWQTGSDCEVLLPLLADEGPEGLARVNGIWALVALEPGTGRWVVARDPVGVMPLYHGRDEAGRLWVASELKAIVDGCPDADVFPPGHGLDSETGELVAFRPRPWRPAVAGARVVGDGAPSAPDESVHVAPSCAPDGDRDRAATAVREGLDGAVRRQLMTDVPWGVLLSGGLDSSLVAACAARHARRRVEDDDRTAAWWPELHSFAIGLEGSPDLAAARQVARALGTRHHSFTFTVEEGLDAVPDVIRHIESWDVTTVRASVPMYLLARRIRTMGVKVVLSGEGADEVFGGYLYFHRAPDGAAFKEETERKVAALHLYDCLRANKAMAAWGVEARVPFLDLDFLDVAMGVPPELRMPAPGPDGTRVEKALLREAFRGVLPPELLWRQKEQFSDGVGYGWIDALRAHAAARVTDEALAAAPRRFPHATPTTPEGLWYRTVFAELFPGRSAARTIPGGPSIACSSPAALAWDPAFRGQADPSGRAVLGVHHHGVALAGGEDARPGDVSRRPGR